MYYLFRNKQNPPYVKMITIKPGGTLSNSEILRIKKSLLGSRLSAINPTNKWTNILPNEKENKQNTWHKNRKNWSKVRGSPKNKSVEVYVLRDH